MKNALIWCNLLRSLRSKDNRGENLIESKNERQFSIVSNFFKTSWKTKFYLSSVPSFELNGLSSQGCAIELVVGRYTNRRFDKIFRPVHKLLSWEQPNIYVSIVEIDCKILKFSLGSLSSWKKKEEQKCSSTKRTNGPQVVVENARKNYFYFKYTIFRYAWNA